jgi:hypothetical protein
LIETEGKDKVEAHEELSRASLSRRESLRSIASFFSSKSIKDEEVPDSPRGSSIQGDSSKFDFQLNGKEIKPNQVAQVKRMSAFAHPKFPPQGPQSPQSGSSSEGGSSPLEVDQPGETPVENKIELAQSLPGETPVENKIELAQSQPGEDNLRQLSD